MNSFDFPSGNPMSDGFYLSPFTGKLVCAHCAHIYRHRTISTKGRSKRYYRWICGAKVKYGSACCQGPNVPETELERLTCEVLGICRITSSVVEKKIMRIEVSFPQTLTFVLRTGESITKIFNYKRHFAKK